MKNKTKFTQNWFYQIIPSKQYLILSEHKNQGSYFMNQPDTMYKHAKIHAKVHHLFLALMNHHERYTWTKYTKNMNILQAEI